MTDERNQADFENENQIHMNKFLRFHRKERPLGISTVPGIARSFASPPFCASSGSRYTERYWAVKRLYRPNTRDGFKSFSCGGDIIISLSADAFVVVLILSSFSRS